MFLLLWNFNKATRFFKCTVSVKNTDISAENKFTARLWECHNVPFLWLVLSYVASSQVMSLTAATDGWEFECWQWSTASWTVGNRMSVVRSLVKNFKVSSSASRFPAEKHAAGSVFTSMTTDFVKERLTAAGLINVQCRHWGVPAVIPLFHLQGTQGKLFRTTV